MLVLSRKPDDSFCFPQLGVNVRVLSVKGRSVRIGIDAPDEFAILRGELASEFETKATAAAETKSHRWKNQLNVVKLSLVLAERHFQAGNVSHGEAALVDAIRELAKMERSVAKVPVPQPSGSAKRVLVVEDDPNELRLLAGLLQLEGYDVATAANGNEAIEQLNQLDVSPDFVLLDMRMPHHNGRETIRWIRDQKPYESLSVISISATSPEELGVAIGPGGVTDWFPKPLDTVRLLKRLNGVQTTAV